MGILTALLVSCNSNKDETSTSNKDANNSENPAFTDVEVHPSAQCPTGEGCFICDPSKRVPGRLWCKEHDRYEDRCWECHPELQDKSRIFCGEHGVYEDECYICHPELKGKKKTSSKTGSSPQSKLMCREHNVLERECAICQPDLASGLKPGESLKIRVASADSLKKSGVGFSQPQLATSQASVKAYCTVDYNQNKVVRITPLSKGVVQRINVNPGQLIKKGSLLAVVHSPELSEYKGRYLSALASERLASLTVDRERSLAQKRISAAADLQAAEAALILASAESSSARQRLINIGMNQANIEKLEINKQPDSILELRAPFDGTIVQRSVSVGEMVSPGDYLFILADLSSMWLELSLPSHQASQIREGMNVTAKFDGIPEASINAKLIWVASAIDPKARRVKARALVANPTPSLRKGLYGNALIHTSPPSQSLSVPTSSIQRIDGIPFVFVREAPDLFAATRINIAATSFSDTITPVSEGLTTNDTIVSKGSYIMRSEFLKSQLGAGCVDD